MNKIPFLLLAGVLVASSASAQVAASSQSSASQQSQAQAQSGKKDAQASGNASASGSTSASAQAGQSSVNLASGTTIDAALSSSLDARKNKEGDQVAARTTQAVKQDGKVIIPKGSKLVGHVTQAKARAKGESESALGIVFDHAILKDGTEIPLSVTIQAVAAAQTAASSTLGETDAMGGTVTSAGGRASGSQGGLIAGAGSTVGAAAGTVSNTAGSVASNAGGAVGSTVNAAGSAAGSAAGANAAGALTSSSTGVIGLHGMSLSSAASSATQGSTIVSSTRNVHLDSGTRLLLRAQGQSQAQ